MKNSKVLNNRPSHYREGRRVMPARKWDKWKKYQEYLTKKAWEQHKKMDREFDRILERN